MKGYVISMDDPTGHARYSLFTERTARFKDLDIERIPAIRGTSLSTEDVAKVTSMTCSLACTPAIVGIAMSHMVIWRRIRDGPDEMALVFEDDAVLHGDFMQDVLEAIDQAGQFHVLNLGCFMCDFRLARSSRGVRDVNGFAGAHAYVLTKEGARKLLDIYDSVIFHIDMMMSAASMRGVILKATNTTLASQDGHETSSNATVYGFPGSLDHVMKQIHFETGTDLSYYANAKHFRLGTWERHMTIDPVMIIFCLIGIYLGMRGLAPWVLITALVAFDVLYMNNPQTTEYAIAMAKTIGSGLLGYVLGSMTRA